MLNIERRSKNEEVEIGKPHESRSTKSLVSCLSLLASESTWYIVLRTLYNEVLLLFLMSNAERRSKNKEVEIRKPHKSRSKTQ